MDVDTDTDKDQENQDQENAVMDDSGLDIDNLSLDQINMNPNGDDQDDNTAGDKADKDNSDDSDSSSSDDGNSDDDDSSAKDDDDSDKDDKSDKDDEQSDDGGTSADTEADTNASEDSKKKDAGDSEDAYLSLSEETGVEVKSYEDVSSKLTELSKLRTQKVEPETYSTAIQEAIKVEKAGGNLADHFARVGMPIDKMEGKELLRQKFFKDEAKLHGTNPKLAQMKFERAYQEKYGIWESYNALTDDTEKEDFLDENGKENIDYEKMMLENDAAVAKTELETWQKEAAPVEVQKPDSSGMTEKEQEEYADKYTAQAEKSLGEFEAVNIPMGEGLKDFALGLNDTTKPMVKGWVNNPHTFLQDIGFDGNKIDTDRLLPIMTLIAEVHSGNLGGRIAKYTIDSDNVETLKKEIKKPPSGSTSPNIPQDRDEGDIWDQIGEKAAEARENHK